MVVRMTRPTYHVPHALVIVAQAWPCWLSTALSLSLPVDRVYAPARFQSMIAGISTKNKLIPSWSTLDAMSTMSNYGPEVIILGSGSFTFLLELPRQIFQSCHCFIFAVEVDFCRYKRERDLDRQLRAWAQRATEVGLDCHVLTHAEFGGVSNARYLVVSQGGSRSCFEVTNGLPRTIGHVINAAASGFFPEIPAPPKLDVAARARIEFDGMLRKEGLLDVFAPLTPIACPSVFSATRWVRRTLLPREI